MIGARANQTGAGRGRLTRAAAALAFAGVVAACATPARASAQLRAGGQLSFATDVFGGTAGIGPRVEFGVPAFPVRLAASWDYFFPDCNQCRYWEGNVNVLVSLPLLPIPFFRHVGGGWHMQNVKANEFEETRVRGYNAVAGLRSGRTNVEFRYEMLEDVDDQFVFSFAIFLL